MVVVMWIMYDTSTIIVVSCHADVLPLVYFMYSLLLYYSSTNCVQCVHCRNT